MTSRKLTHEQKVNAERLRDMLCEEYNVSVEKVCAKNKYPDLKEVRKQIYQRLRMDMGLTFAKIGEVCNRAEDTISTAFQEDGISVKRWSKKVLTPPTVPDDQPVAQKLPDNSVRNGVTRAGASGNTNSGIHVRLVTTWISKDDDMRLRKLLAKHRVSQEDMVRGMIVDALHEAEQEETV